MAIHTYHVILDSEMLCHFYIIEKHQEIIKGYDSTGQYLVIVVSDEILKCEMKLLIVKGRKIR